MNIDPIAICCSDLHFSLKPPIARSAEPDWLAAMKRPLTQIRELQKRHNWIPILAAGDLFHHYNEPAELINFVISYLPQPCYAVYGQHDLRFHAKQDIKKTAYWTLVKAGVITHLNEDCPVEIENNITLHGFSWESELKPRLLSSKQLNVALVHKYIWNTGAVHGGQPNQSDHVREFSSHLKGFDVAIVGDNHTGFNYEHCGVKIMNCGSLFPRTADQRTYIPQVGLLFADRTIIPHYLDVSEDKWTAQIEKSTKQHFDLTDLKNTYKNLARKHLDILTELKQLITIGTEIDLDTQEILKELIEELSQQESK